MGLKFVFETHRPEVESQFDLRKKVILEELGMTAESNAKLALTHSPKRIDTGTLLRSITHRTEENSAVISTNVDYGFWVYTGTRRMTPNRFLRRGIERHKPVYYALIKQMLDS